MIYFETKKYRHPGRNTHPYVRAVEEVAGRFQQARQRTDVRFYLYAMTGDMNLVRRFGGDRLRSRRQMRAAARRAKENLEVARRKEPELYDGLMAGIQDLLKARLRPATEWGLED